MFRLLQGDVGSGKTAVAFLAMLKAAGQGSQSCMLAPTEVLTVQHLQVRVAPFLSALLRSVACCGSLYTGLLGCFSPHPRLPWLSGWLHGQVQEARPSTTDLQHDVQLYDGSRRVIFGRWLSLRSIAPAGRCVRPDAMKKKVLHLHVGSMSARMKMLTPFLLY